MYLVAYVLCYQTIVIIITHLLRHNIFLSSSSLCGVCCDEKFVVVRKKYAWVCNKFPPITIDDSMVVGYEDRSVTINIFEDHNIFMR